MKLNHADDTPTDYGLQLTKFDEQVISRHHKVAEVIRRHLKDIHTEILRLDPEMLIWTTPATRPRSPARSLLRWSSSCAGLPRGCGSRLQSCRGEETTRVLIPAAAMGQRRGSLGLDQVGSRLMGSAVFAVVHHDFR
jgi:hypothetical protein